MKNTKKILVMVFHPDIENSKINKKWVETLRKYPDNYEVYELYSQYPDEKIDIEKEQHLLENYDKIILQFPFYWFSSPPLLKKYFDEVLTYGWAYGSKSGYKLSDKKIGVAISAGLREDEYQHNAEYKYTLEELLRPIELSVEYVRAEFAKPFPVYGIEIDISAEKIEESATQYLDYLQTF